MPAQNAHPKPNMLSLIKPYRGMVFVLVACTIGANALNLAVPKVISRAVDAFVHGRFDAAGFIFQFSIVAILIFLLTYAQSVVQTIAAERAGRDLRTKLMAKISAQDPAFVSRATPAKLLTNLTSDVDAVKAFISQAISSIISSVFLIIGASVLLIATDWRLGLIVLAVMPLIGFTFAFIFGKVRTLFVRAQGAIDRLNKVINESILGAALIRLVNAEHREYEKFLSANTEAKQVSLSILKLFASLIPVITFLTNLATLAILVFGGKYVIAGTMTIGDFTAFNGYLAILIFPIFILGFMSTVIGQATASYARIEGVLGAEDRREDGSLETPLSGEIRVEHLSLALGGKQVLKDISFVVPPGSRIAVIGPTGAGKTQLLYALVGLVEPSSGQVLFDGHGRTEYKAEAFREEIGIVFQDSVLFNLTLRENIAFNARVSDERLRKAVDAAELGDFVASLPHGLDTMVSERGTSLSGGQKQRVMLARALALDPKILFLDDFTARVDAPTEKKILDNLRREYPDITLVSVTQKISSIGEYGCILVLEDGELLASGTHEELMRTSPEYVQIHDSQQSTQHYEVRA